ncbi:hypothetical protein Dda_1036 [Drechslerella dactyloides]|uniref:Uncharacterized protein n=1 Tax=Drechslerella dactyloides TaxID=74499 RepID=A0AAD6J5D3_DREDA|nr:hypothetical protein Dda_1036 [Drechslerella dactyloides]
MSSASKNSDLLDFAKDMCLAVAPTACLFSQIVKSMSANNITPPDTAPPSKRPDQGLERERESATTQDGGGKNKQDSDARDDKLASTRKTAN